MQAMLAATRLLARRLRLGALLRPEGFSLERIREGFQPMNRHFSLFWLATLGLLFAAGCAPTQPFYFFEKGDLSHYVGMATKLEAPDVDNAHLSEVTNPMAPLSLSNMKFERIWDLQLEDAVHLALENSKIIRTLGARFATQGGTRPQVGDAPTVLLTSPTSVPSTFDPSIVETNPLSGVEGALASFDALLSASATWEHDDVPQNALLAAGSILNRVELQDIDTLQTGITKRSAVGTTVGIQTTATYTNSNSPLLESPHDNSLAVDFTLTQRLLRGGGLLFNQIHGPLDPSSGDTNLNNWSGVTINRINEDMSLADFEAAVRNLVNDTENGYWELYFAYRALDAAKVGRDSALETWKKIHALAIANAKGGEADKEAESRDQYFTFRAQVEQALTDLYRTENRLRYLMGLAATDGRLIRPKDEPTTAKVVFDWTEVHQEALARSVELRKEKWKIKQLELELIASKNLLLPNLDFQGRYRLFGLGEDLLAGDDRSYRGLPTDTILGTNAGASLEDNPAPSWNLGFVFSVPIGLRRELATIRNQQLLLAREKAVLQDQELELSHEITDVVRNLDTQYHLMETNFNRRKASEEEVRAVEVAYEAGTVTLDLLLQAQQRRSDAEAAYYRSLVDYTRGIGTVHWAKGSLLEYNNVYLAEGPWPAKAYFDAHRLARARDAGLEMDYGYSRPDVFSRGPIPQHADANIQGGDANGTPTPAGEEIQKGTVSPLLPAQPDNSGAGKGASLRQPKFLQNDGPQLGGGWAPQATQAGGSDATSSGAGADNAGTGSGIAPTQWKGTSGQSADAGQAAPQASATAGGWKKAQPSFAGE